MKDLYKECGEVYVDKDVFHKCFVDIKDSVNVNVLVAHMMKHNMVTRRRDTESLLNNFITPDQQMERLLDLINKGGTHSYFLFYVCLYESMLKDKNKAHKEAVTELQKTGITMQFNLLHVYSDIIYSFCFIVCIRDRPQFHW